MPYRTVSVDVDVDVSDVLDEISDDDLREELQKRAARKNQGDGVLCGPDPWWALQHDLDFQMALNRGDADEIMRRVQNAFCASSRRAA